MIQEISKPESLSQLLQMQLTTQSLDYYALSLVHSRTQPPNQEILACLKVLVSNHNKWLEVTRRLAGQSPESYLFVSQAYFNEFVMYRTFLNEAFMRGDQDTIGIMKESLLRIAQCGGVNEVTVEVFFETLSMFLLESMGHQTQFFLPFFSAQFSVYLNQNLNANEHVSKCLIILIEKFLKYQRRNSFQSKFGEVYSQFNTLLQSTFRICLETTNEVTLEILSLLTEKPSMYNLYMASSSQLLNTCETILNGFNEMVNSKFKEEYQEMINYEDDIINYHRSKTVYSEGAKLLQRMMGNIDGMLVSLFERNLSLIKQIFINSAEQNAVSKLELLYLELLIIAKPLRQRADLLEELTEFIGDYFDNIFRLQPNAPALNSRLISLIAEFINEFPSKYFQLTIGFLFKGIESPMDGFVLRLYKTLETIMNTKELYKMIEPSLANLSSRLIYFLSEAETFHYFELFESIIIQYDQISQRYFSRILSLLTQRIHIEVKVAHSKGANTNESIKHIYRCIKVLFRKPDLVQQLYDTIQPILEEHAAYLSNPHQIDFQEQILNMAAQILNKGKTLTPFIISCLGSIKGIYEKNKDIESIFQLFYSLCTHATDSLLENSSSVEFMTNILLEYLKEQVAESCYWTGAYGRGCILFQLVIQHLEPLFIEGELRERVIIELLNIYQNLKTAPHSQFINILISLFYISPFQLEIAPESLKLSEYYNNKLRSLYYIAKLRQFYSEDNLQKALGYYKSYIEHYESKPKTINPHTNKEYLVDVDEEKYLEDLNIPLREVNDLVILQSLLKELKQAKKIDHLELSEEEGKTLGSISKMSWCGKEMRKIYKFTSNQ